jgi:prophage regulatory protein
VKNCGVKQRDAAMQDQAPPHRRSDGFARKAERRQITGPSDTNWDTLEKEGKAPKRVKLGPRSVGWLRSELWAWVDARVAERDASWQKLSDLATRAVSNLPDPQRLNIKTTKAKRVQP